MQKFSKFLGEIHNGRTDEDITNELKELVRAVETTRKKGCLTVEVRASMDGDMLVLEFGSKVKIPKAKRPGVMRFVQNGELYEDDPRQLSLPVSVPVGRPGPVDMPEGSAQGDRTVIKLPKKDRN